VQNFASTAFIHFLELDQASTWERVRARKGAEARVVPMVVTPNVAGERMELRDKGVEKALGKEEVAAGIRTSFYGINLSRRRGVIQISLQNLGINPMLIS
jgi:hypothetical protein